MKEQKPKRRLKKPIRRFIQITLTIIIVVPLIFGTYYANKYYTIYKNFKEAYELIYDDTIPAIKHQDSFTILFVGIDAVEEVKRSDSLILAVVDPIDNEISLISIPRDTYVPIACMDDYSDKITHAYADGGLDCTKQTVSNFLDVEINYIVQMSFMGFISIIDYLGTINVNVPDFNNGEPWCEQDSTTVADQICFTQFGNQEVNSEQALALARTRYYDSDLFRGQRQMEIINAVLTKVMSLPMEEKLNFDKAITAVSDYFMTNMDFKTFLSTAYSMKDLTIDLSNNMYQIPGYDDYFVGDLSDGVELYFFVPDEEELETIKLQIDTILAVNNKK